MLDSAKAGNRRSLDVFLENLGGRLKDLGILAIVKVGAENPGRVDGGDSVSNQGSASGSDDAHLVVIAIDEVGQQGLGMDL